MKDRALNPSDKLGLGVACTACCAVPMLILTGLLSAGAALAGGVAIGSVVAVGVTTYAVITRRIRGTRPAARVVLAGSGAALAIAGLLTRTNDLSGALLASGLATLAISALLALAASGLERGPLRT